MFKGDGNTVAVTSTTVTVTPQSVNGNEVDCSISGSDVSDDAIFLDHSHGYDITIKLKSGPGGSYNFHPTKPFCNQKGKCPPELPGGSAHNPFSVTPIDATSILVHCDPVPGKGVAHYRLNFDNGMSCDPIIIHD